MSKKIVQRDEEVIKGSLRNWFAAARKKHAASCWSRRQRS